MLKKWSEIKNTDAALLLIRIALGLVFINSGYAKLVGMTKTIAFFAKLGFSPFWAYLVMLVELLGGILVLLGIFAEYVGIFLAVDMATAIIKVTGSKGLNGSELELTLLLSALAVAIAGAGKYSVEEFFKEKGNRIPSS